jgi:ParB/RepB/Spo0J family partition protein
MTKKDKGIVRPDFSRQREQKLDLSHMFAAGMSTQVLDDGEPGTGMEGARMLPVDKIDPNPYQSRQVFDVASLRELADSIREHGVIEPLIVRASEAEEGRYEIVAGERRYKAAILAEQETVPARIMELDAKQAAIVTALENLQREDLDIEDEARQFAYLCEALEVSQRELARMLGKNHVYIARRIRLLRRPDLMEEYRSGRLMLLQATALADTADTEGEGGGTDGAEAGVDNDGETVSPRNTLPAAGEGHERDDEGNEEGSSEYQLLEREDLTGFVVKRSAGDAGAGGINKRLDHSRAGSAGGRRPMFRWRPLIQFHNWVDRTRIVDIPPDERATVRRQITEIKEALEKQLVELEQMEDEATTLREPVEPAEPEEKSNTEARSTVQRPVSI